MLFQTYYWLTRESSNSSANKHNTTKGPKNNKKAGKAYLAISADHINTSRESAWNHSETWEKIFVIAWSFTGIESVFRKISIVSGPHFFATIRCTNTIRIFVVKAPGEDQVKIRSKICERLAHIYWGYLPWYWGRSSSPSFFGFFSIGLMTSQICYLHFFHHQWSQKIRSDDTKKPEKIRENNRSTLKECEFFWWKQCNRVAATQKMVQISYGPDLNDDFLPKKRSR